MHPRPDALLYGTPPAGLVDIAPAAVQLSPLMPGAARLSDIAPQCAMSAVIYAPHGTLERRYVLARTLTALSIGAPLTVLAMNTKGGSRLKAELEAFGCEVSSTAKAHHRMVTTLRPRALAGVDEAIAAGSPQQHPAHGLWTQPGVFSWDRVDAGSALLIEQLPTFSGAGADLGAGIGVLSRAVLASPQVSALTLIDIDRRAIDCAKRNLEDARAAFIWTDVREPEDLPVGLDFVVMNPPFHDTGVEEKALGQAFIKSAAFMLKPGGVCWLVANRHLPYEATLAQYFATTRMVADAEGFKIFESVA